MRKNIIAISAAFAALAIGGSACAETVWNPPAEISNKAQAQAGDAGAAPAAPGAPAAAAPAAPESKADKEKSCKEQAEAKGLKGKAKKQFKAECLKS